MSSKVLVFLGTVCILCSCWGDEGSQEQQDIPRQLDSPTPSEDLDQDTSAWGFWQPWKFWKWGQSMLNDALTNSANAWQDGHHIHRDGDSRGLSTGRAQSTARLFTESTTSLPVQRPRGSVRKELVSMMFDSMLDSIVDSWEVIQPPKEESSPNFEFGKSPSELTVAGKKKKSAGTVKSKIKRSRSKLDLENEQTDLLQQCWWSSPDERAVVRFKNGNVYEGNISMKCMHGEGRYQWADGTVYLGHFKDNDINGKGIIQWKDDTWYEGDFIGNLRHGRGLYVDSRRQRSYYGGWHCGTKHGEGMIYYSNTNSYDGEWIHNVRHGFGSREYCSHSGYKGEWDQNVREGKGLIIWPNYDFYRGEWKNGVMSGYGIYIWDAYCNNTLALPSINAYRGLWIKGQRNGYGVLNLGLGHGSHYKGEFKNNKKHGVGKFISNNGLILQGKNLFIDDNIAPLLFDNNENGDNSRPQQLEPYRFDICDSTVGMLYHIEQALNNIDKQVEIRTNMINEYIENNKSLEVDTAVGQRSGGQCFPSPLETENVSLDIEDLINFEETSLRKSLRCYETDLKNIYYKYATICNTEEILFTPVLIRLFLWQFYFDCNVHERGLNLVDIDRIFHQNPEWLSRNAHDPFEKVYFWQFMHSLISVARILYAKKELPGTKPDTILASAFRMFMERNVLPGAGRRRGKLANGYATLVPLKGLYKLYRSLGEPHTVRTYLCAVRSPPHCLDRPQATLVETPDDALPLGRNVYIFGDEITFFTDENRRPSEDDEWDNDEEESQKSEYRLFNFANLSNKTIIKIFAEIFPQISRSDLIMNLDVEITFYEFFEAFFACAEESIRVKDEELRWRERFSENDEAAAAAAVLTTLKSKK